MLMHGKLKSVLSFQVSLIAANFIQPLFPSHESSLEGLPRETRFVPLVRSRLE